MNYEVEILKSAIKDLQQIDKKDAKVIVEKISLLRNGLVGDIKKLKYYSPGYRLRVGNYRVLFSHNGTNIVVGRILHRKQAYN